MPIPTTCSRLVGSDGDLVDFIPADTGIARTNTPGVYQDLVTRYEGGSGAAGSGCASLRLRSDGQSPGHDRPPRIHHPLRPQRVGRGLSHDQPAALQFPRGELFRRQSQRRPASIPKTCSRPSIPPIPRAPPTPQFTPSGSGNTAHVPMQPGPGGSVRPGWFTNLYSFDLLDDRSKRTSTPPAPHPPA